MRLPEIFGERLVGLRTIAGMSQRELSDATGERITVPALSRMERGERKDITVTEALSLAAALRVSPLSLMLGNTGEVEINGETYPVGVVWKWCGAIAPNPAWETELTPAEQRLGFPLIYVTTPAFAKLDAGSLNDILNELDEREVG